MSNEFRALGMVDEPATGAVWASVSSGLFGILGAFPKDTFMFGAD